MSMATGNSLSGLVKSLLCCLVQSSLDSMMSQLANLPELRHLELRQNSGITGPLADTDSDTSSGLCRVVQVCIAGTVNHLKVRWQ